ncbi:MAG: hypothetical protein WDM90_03790 [Ferruginibacter sp.]
MKKLTCIICLFIIYINHTAAQMTDTIIKGVAVVFKYDVSIFPAEWRTAEINAVGAYSLHCTHYYFSISRYS